MTDEYIRRQDMLDAVEALDIIPSVDGKGNPTNTEDFRVQFLGTVLKVKPADVVSKNEIAVLLDETVKELTSKRKNTIADSFIVSVIGIVKCKIRQMGEKTDG